MISRYMNSYVFISQLIQKEIYFSPLIYLDDPTEGQLKNFSFFDKVIFGGKNKNQSEKERELIKNKIISEVHKYHVSCWTMDHIENYSLWSIYTDKLTGIMVTSTIEKFLTSVAYSDKILHNHIHYISNNMIFTNNSYTDINERIFSKTAYYSYENEYRFAIKNGTVFNKKNELEKYLTVPIDFSSLIINIILSPFMSAANKTYFRDTLNRLCPELADRIIDSKIKLKKNI